MHALAPMARYQPVACAAADPHVGQADAALRSQELLARLWELHDPPATGSALPQRLAPHFTLDLFGGVIAQHAERDSLAAASATPLFPLARGGGAAAPNLLLLHAATSAHMQRIGIIWNAIIMDHSTAPRRPAGASAEAKPAASQQGPDTEKGGSSAGGDGAQRQPGAAALGTGGAAGAPSASASGPSAASSPAGAGPGPTPGPASAPRPCFLKSATNKRKSKVAALRLGLRAERLQALWALLTNLLAPDKEPAELDACVR